jgi:hypothetical protein
MEHPLDERNRYMNRFRIAALAVVSLALLAGASVVLGGCSSKTTSAPASAPAESSTAAVAAPTLELVSPSADSAVPSGDVNVSVKTTGLNFVMPGNTNVAGEGHVHFSLDGQPIEMSVKPDYVYVGVAPGAHTLKAELVQNDTKSFNPPVEQEITFKAE